MIYTDIESHLKTDTFGSLDKSYIYISLESVSGNLVLCISHVSLLLCMSWIFCVDLGFENEAALPRLLFCFSPARLARVPRPPLTLFLWLYPLRTHALVSLSEILFFSLRSSLWWYVFSVAGSV